MTVPAGTFQGLRVASWVPDNDGVGVQYHWLVEGIGWVLTEDMHWLVGSSVR